MHRLAWLLLKLRKLYCKVLRTLRKLNLNILNK